MSYATARRRDSNAEVNKLYPEDRAVHEWYRFVLSFPPHIVRRYLKRLAFAKAAVFSFSNLHFGPEVGIGPAKPDAAVLDERHYRLVAPSEVSADDLAAYRRRVGD